MSLPGDELVADPLLQTTHGVTIDAPPQQVWPWLVQIGQGRAGFYSDSRFWDRCVDWYYRLLSREQAAAATVGYHVAADDHRASGCSGSRVVICTLAAVSRRSTSSIAATNCSRCLGLSGSSSDCASSSERLSRAARSRRPAAVSRATRVRRSSVLAATSTRDRKSVVEGKRVDL